MADITADAASCNVKATHAYLVIGPGDTEEAIQNARQAIQKHVQRYLDGAAISWHLDYSHEPVWKSPFLCRPAAAALNAELRPGDHVVIWDLYHFTSAPRDLKDTIRDWLARGVHLHLASVDLGDRDVRPEEVGPLLLLAFEWTSRICAGKGVPRRKARSKRRGSRRKARSKKPPRHTSTRANHCGDDCDAQPPLLTPRVQNPNVPPGVQL